MQNVRRIKTLTKLPYLRIRNLACVPLHLVHWWFFGWGNFGEFINRHHADLPTFTPPPTMCTIQHLEGIQLQKHNGLHVCINFNNYTTWKRFLLNSIHYTYNITACLLMYGIKSKHHFTAMLNHKHTYLLLHIHITSTLEYSIHLLFIIKVKSIFVR